MPKPDKLSIEEIEGYCGDDMWVVSTLAAQLLNTMRENQRLHGIIEACECGAGEAIADHPNKESDSDFVRKGIQKLKDELPDRIAFTKPISSAHSSETPGIAD